MSLVIASVLFSGCFSQSPPTQPAVAPPQEPSAVTPPAAPTPPPPVEPSAPPVPVSAKPIPPPPPVSIVQKVSVESGNLFFKPSTITVKVNQPVQVSITNKGGHTFTITEFGVNLTLNSASASTTFTPTKTGSFPITCGVPGHKEAGMTGTLVVTE